MGGNYFPSKTSTPPPLKVFPCGARSKVLLRIGLVKFLFCYKVQDAASCSVAKREPLQIRRNYRNGSKEIKTILFYFLRTSFCFREQERLPGKETYFGDGTLLGL